MLRVGVIGAGYIGKKRAEVVFKSSRCSLRAVCDIDAQKGRLLAQTYNCAFTNDWKKIVNDNDIDAVIAATANDKLAAISIAALNKNKHVLCEKPLGRDVNEARQIYKAAMKNKRILKVGFNHRFHPAIHKAFNMCRKDAIGEVMYIRALYGHGARRGYDREWRMNAKISGGGELIDQGVHIIDLFRWFLGDFKEVFAVNMNAFWKSRFCEDNSFMVLRTKDKRVASGQVSITQWRNRFLFEIFGKSGYLIVDGLGKSYGAERLIYGKRKMLGKRPIERVFEFPGEDVSWKLEWQEFVNAVNKGMQPLGNGYDGLKANEIVAALYKSAKTEKMTKI